ncbi:hypothetical protein Tco_1309372 [Tanacetum coccineum]
MTEFPQKRPTEEGAAGENMSAVSPIEKNVKSGFTEVPSTRKEYTWTRRAAAMRLKQGFAVMSIAFAELGAMAVKWQNRPQPNLIGLLAKGSLECRSWVKKMKRMEKKGGGLSQSEKKKELKKLLGTNNGRNELDSEQKDDNDDDDDHSYLEERN